MSSAVQSAKSLIEEAQGLLAEAATLAASHGGKGEPEVGDSRDGLGALVEDFADVKRRVDAVDGARIDDMLARISVTVTGLNGLRERIALIRRSRRVLGGGF